MNHIIDHILPLLHCPNTKQPLCFVPSTESSSLDFKVVSGCADELTGFLRGTSEGFVYPIRGRIIDLRPESAIVTNTALRQCRKVAEHARVQRNVQEWYDSFGWKRNGEGVLNDSAHFSQPETSLYGLYEKMSHLAQAERYSGGEMLLDAASGAIAHPEYLAYSYYHRFRVCVDFSEVALQEASQRIGDHGIFVLADICQLPFVDDSFHGVMSGYTVQHVHRDQQRGAIEELFRVLKPGCRLCIMASQETGFAHRQVLRIGVLLSKLLRFFSAEANFENAAKESSPVAPPYQLYGHCWSYKWWKDCARSLSSNSQVYCLRLFGKSEFSRVIKSPTAVRRLRGFETLFSATLARASSLIVVDVEKCKFEQSNARKSN